MSVSGWAQDGTPRLICLDPPGGDGLTPAFTPNVFLGQPWPQSIQPAAPTITPGTSDMALELWAKRRIQVALNTDLQFYSGLLLNASGGLGRVPREICSIAWSGSSNAAVARFDALGPGGTAAGAVSGTPNVLGVWNHYVVNVDRSGNMEFFIDMVSEGTDDVSGHSADSATGEFMPLTNDYAGDHHHATLSFDAVLDSIANWPVIVGPAALHSRLLTNAEIKDSYLNRSVQNLSTTSYIVQTYKGITGQTGWDTDWDNMNYSHKFGISMPAAAPLGAANTVTVPDLSGNDNDWTLQTATDWTTYEGPVNAEDGTWPLAFGSDPFFR